VFAAHVSAKGEVYTVTVFASHVSAKGEVYTVTVFAAHVSAKGEVDTRIVCVFTSHMSVRSLGVSDNLIFCKF
jgi:hypothetical protein